MKSSPDRLASCYKSNFLSEVIARVDFLSSLPDLAEHLPPALASLVRASFPIAEPREAVAHKVRIDKDGLKPSSRQFKEWAFHGAHREKSLVITADAMYVTYSAYTTYEALKADFLAATKGLIAAYPEVQTKRLGLRYVNVIERDEPAPVSWEKYITSELLGLFRLPGYMQVYTRVFHNVEVKLMNCNLRFQFGMHNPDYPAVIRRKVFVLDYDAYSQAPFEPSQLQELLDEYHLRIQEAFESSITDGLREVMNAGNRDRNGPEVRDSAEKPKARRRRRRGRGRGDTPAGA